MSLSRPRRLRTGAAAVLAAGALAATGLAPAQAGPTPSAVAPLGDYIVVLDDDATAGRVAQRHADRLGLTVGHVYSAALQGYSARMPAAAVPLLEALPQVQSVEADRPVRTTAQSTPTGIARTLATQSPTASIDGVDDRVDVDVAVIDTGVQLNHPDLNVYRPGAKACGLLNLSADDAQGHGTHVAGTIGALDNGTGVVGVAPGARIWPVRVLNALGTGSTSDVICGIDHVAANADEIEVANMSLGGAGTDYGSCGAGRDAMHKAICNAVDAGVTFVVAAGNESSDAATSTPAAYDEVITVSALADFDGRPGGLGQPTCRTDVDDTFADFSNYGADVDLIAPGVCIESTWLRGGYNTISGTSMASPHVAGGAALYLARNPGASPAQVQAALIAAGSDDWDASDDPDGVKEPLLDVSAF
ncbi:MAG: S8 family serine peptidase [Nocardioides sp.]|nr:S8 family serine peptidase [Nocardioides sp.]